MSGGTQMTDQDRSAGPEGHRSAEESDADWFFRDRSDSTQHSDSDNAYYGPFGQQPQPVDDPTQVLPGYGPSSGPSYPPPTGSPYGPANAPAGPGGAQAGPSSGSAGPGNAQAGPGGGSVPPTSPTPSRLPSTAVYSPVPPQHQGPGPIAGREAPRRPRTGLIVLLSVLLAALVGTAAGYGGAKLANSGASTTSPTTGPLPRPSQTGAPRTPVPPAPGQIDTVQVAATALPSTVMIRVGSGRSGGTGSGFVLDTAGHIMTNNHVIAGAADGGRITVVFSDGARVEAKLVGRSPSYDLAVIKLDGPRDLVPMAIGDSDNLQVGESVIAIGSPLALASTVTQGIVSAKNRPVVVNSNSNAADSPSAYINGIQTDAAINPGNSGGPLVDAGARVIGVNSAILTMGQSADTGGNIGLGFAIPINQAMVIGKQLISEGRATYPVIGVNVGNDSSDGVRLSEVDGGGPADEAGLRVDDVITKIDDQPVDTAAELIVAIRTHRPGDRVTLTYQRGAQEQTAEVTLGSREG